MAAVNGTSSEASLNELWAEAQRNFAEKTSKSLKRVSLADALEAIDKKVDATNTEESAKKKKLKAVASDVLNLINLLGGVVAQGVSIVFGPAGMCFNAIQFLMDIPKMISKFYDDIQQLFSTVSTFLKQFRIYQRIEDFKSLDQEMLYSTHKIMTTFIDICALTIELFDGRKRTTIKLTTKLVLFNNDSGVEARLDEFRRLVEHHGRIENAITLEHVMKAEHDAEDRHVQLLVHLREQAEATADIKDNVGFLYQQAAQQSIKDQWHEYKVKILERLAIKKPQTEKTKDTQSSQVEFPPDPYKDFQQRLEVIEQSTGKWLEELATFQTWADHRAQTDSMVLLSGVSGTGKSCLAAAVLEKLKRNHHETDFSLKREVFVTCFCFDQPGRSPRETIDLRWSSFALKSIAFQLAEQSFKYAKALQGHVDKKHVSFSRDLSPRSLADVLLEPFDQLGQTENKLYIVMDGFEKLPQEERRPTWDALVAMRSHKIRILLTGTQDAFEEMEYANDSIELIDIAQHNESDLQMYIECTLNKTTGFKDQAPALQTVRPKIMDELPGIVRGNFADVDYILDKIVTAFNDDEDHTVMEQLVHVDTLKLRKQDVGQDIDKLARSLNDHEIKQLNELLMWVLYAEENMSINELTAALILRLKRGTNQDLKTKIGRKFSTVLRCEKWYDGDDIVYIKDDDIENFFRESHRIARSSSDEADLEPRITMEISINNAKLSHVRKFFWDLSKKTVLENFEKSFFDEARVDENPRSAISADKVDSKLNLTRRCFEILLDESEEVAILHRYAMQNLTDHLTRLKEEVGYLTLPERAEILKSLVDLLRSPSRVRKYIDGGFLWGRAWLDKDRGLGALTSWLSDEEAAVGKLRRVEQVWVDKILEGPPAECLLNFAPLVADYWFCSRENSAPAAYSWLNEFLILTQKTSDLSLTKTKSRSNGTEKSENESAEDEDSFTAAQRVDRAIEWAKSKTDVDTNTSLCQERIGEVLLWFDDADGAKNAFSKATEFEDSSWQSFRGLARALADTEQYDAAVEKISIALERLRGDRTSEISKDDTEFLNEMLVECAQWEGNLGHHQSAIARYKEAIKIHPLVNLRYADLLNVYIDADCMDEAADFLKKLHQEYEGNQTDQSKLGDMLLASAVGYNSELHFGVILHVATHSNMMGMVYDTIKDMLSWAREQKNDDVLMSLLLLHGVLLSRHSSGEDHREAALGQLMDCCDQGLDASDWDMQSKAVSAAIHIFNHYIYELRVGNTPSDRMLQVTKRIEEHSTKPSTDNYFEQQWRYMMVNFHMAAKQEEKARALVEADVKQGLNLLSDDDDDNDWLGYRSLIFPFLHIGKHQDALSAISLYGPERRYGTKHSNGYYCDGPHRGPRKGTWSQSFWLCTVCYDVALCDECLREVKDGTIRSILCSPHHHWLRGPLWEDEYEELGKDHVRVGGTIEDGARVGGEKVLITEWLEQLRKEWAWVKPKEEEETKEANPNEAKNSD